MKNCFIVMPITTPDFALTEYRGDKDHFRHVLDHLFIPAITKAELEPIPPTTKGSEIIHGEVVKNIETSDLVLCDISCLNANVFFELGIRTALNKPVCLVKDNITKDVPFDTNAINYHEYRCHLHIWDNEKEIEKLLQHLKDTIEKSDNKNSLWKYFSITSRAESLSQATEGSDKYEYLVMQMDAIRKQLGNIDSLNAEPAAIPTDLKKKWDELRIYMVLLDLPESRYLLRAPDTIILTFAENLNDKSLSILQSVAQRLEVNLSIRT